MTAAAAVSPAPLSSADLSRVAQDLQLKKAQVEAVVQLLDEENTVPFITRYRKERTGGLNEVAIRLIQDRVRQIRHLADRRATILKAIEAQGKLTPELKAAIESAEHPRRLEDLYLPFKPKKKSLAADAREKGLEPFAAALWCRDPAVANLDEVLPGMVNPEKQLNSTDDVLTGAKHILAELIAETADLRACVRKLLWETAKIATAKSEKLIEGKGLEYKDYFQFSDPVLRVPPHRILAINRGERENALGVKIEYDAAAVREAALTALPQLVDHPHRELLLTVVDDALSRLVLPSLEREVRRELTDVALRHAVEVFARNLRGLLMQPPLRGKRVLAVDPGFRTGCKLAVLDENGTPLEDAVIFPHAPQKRLTSARLTLEKLIRKHQTPVIAVGNGTACRETEELVGGLITLFEKRRAGEAPPEEPEEAAPAVEATVIPEIGQVTFVDPNAPTPVPLPVGEAAAGDASPAATPPPLPKPDLEKELVKQLRTELAGLPEPPPDLAYVIVNEAGASDYSASPAGREEFPNLDATLRGTISIGRRLLDPLSELVKIDPQHVGVGLYQHDIHGKQLKGSLEAIIESCVNHVGVDLNSASAPLLRHVAGFNQLVARELLEYRQNHGAFKRREDIAQVPSIGPARYTQAAGFLKIADGEEPLDATWIHPESYELARKILADLGHTPADLGDKAKVAELREKLNRTDLNEMATKYGAGVPTIDDICAALARPGRDPREDLPPPIFRRDVLQLEDLQPGMELKGTVLNVVDFGAFVDIGLKDSGLVHISQLANRYIRNPHEVCTVGDVVAVWVMGVDKERRRVSLTMIPPGVERAPQEKPKPRSFAPGGRTQREPRPEGQPGGRPQRFDGNRPPRQGDRRGPRRQGAQAIPKQGDTEVQVPRTDRKPRPPKPLPTLSKAKKEGKAYLTTLSELEAFFKNRDGESAAPPPPSPSGESTGPAATPPG